MRPDREPGSTTASRRSQGESARLPSMDRTGIDDPPGGMHGDRAVRHLSRRASRRTHASPVPRRARASRIWPSGGRSPRRVAAHETDGLAQQAGKCRPGAQIAQTVKSGGYIPDWPVRRRAVLMISDRDSQPADIETILVGREPWKGRARLRTMDTSLGGDRRGHRRRVSARLEPRDQGAGDLSRRLEDRSGSAHRRTEGRACRRGPAGRARGTGSAPGDHPGGSR